VIIRISNDIESRNARREVTANWRDVIIKNKKEKTCIMIDVEITADRNFMKADIKLNINLCTEIQPMWNMKCVFLTFMGPCIVKVFF
jgi:hypothetical protein